ncbi:MAG: DUF4857 domain-containing protein [Desulfobulbaceae bacterium]|nr:DUF4857 domain-containing protein [Desulfobulbaceae bacterium]
MQKQFIYRESLGGNRFNYMNEEGTSYSRTEFEAQLPFLYYKNLEKKKQLPFTIDGRSFDKKTIKAGKQGFETKSRHLIIGVGIIGVGVKLTCWSAMIGSGTVNFTPTPIIT